MKTKKLLTAFAAALIGMAASHGQSILLGGYDGTQTQSAIAPATNTSNTGVRQLTGGKQDAGAVTKVSTRIWTDQTTNKEFQWAGALQASTTTGNWGLSDFTTDAQTGSAIVVITQQPASWVNFEITNTGSDVVILDKFHIAVKRDSATVSPTQLTITLEQNGTYANPVVLSASPLAALPVGTNNTITLVPTGTAFNGYELSLQSILSDFTLEAGETATFRIANNAGTNRMFMDNFAISGIVNSTPAGIVDAGTSTVKASPTALLINESSTIAVNLKDANGIPVGGENVTLANTSGPMAATISPSATLTTNDSGVAVFTINSSTPGTEVFTATSSTNSVTVTQTASVDFQAALVDAGTSTVSNLRPFVLADGTDTSTVTVTLKNAGGLPLSGKLVSLAGNQSAVIAPAGVGTSTTNASGVATFTVKSGNGSTEIFTATSESVSITQTASVQFLPVVTTPPVLAPTASKQSTRAGSALDVSNLFNGTGMWGGGAYMYNLNGSDPGEPTGGSNIVWEATLSNLVAQDFIDGKFWLVFDLGASKALHSISLWNYQINGLTVRGVNQFDVYVRNTEADTDDGTALGTAINANNTGGAPVNAFNLGTTNPWQVALSNQTLNQAPNNDSNAAQTFSLTGNTARFVAIVIDSNHGNNKMGLGKVRIYENTAPPGNDYATWSGGAAADGDANGDGVENAVAYALGAADVDENAIGLLPTLDNSDPSNIVFTFDRSDAAEADGTTTITVEYGSNLNGWTTAVHGEGGVSIDDSAVPSAGLHTVVVTIPKSGGKLFARLKVVVSP